MDEHLTRDLFRAIATGWRNPGDLATIALAHLFELCPECRREFETWRQEVESASSVPETPDYEAAIDRIRRSVEETPGRGESPVKGGWHLLSTFSAPSTPAATGAHSSASRSTAPATFHVSTR